MAARSYMPETDNGLLAWSGSLIANFQSSPGDFGISVEQAAQYASLQHAFSRAMQACEASVRNKASVLIKNTARDELKANTRLLVSIIKGQADVTDAQKATLGVSVVRPRSAIQSPDAPPCVRVVSVVGSTVQLRLVGSGADRRGKPQGIAGAGVYSFEGQTPPTDPALWKYEGNTTRPAMTIQVPPTTPPGTQIWFTAYWYNPRAQRGPLSLPIYTHIQFGGGPLLSRALAA